MKGRQAPRAPSTKPTKWGARLIWESSFLGRFGRLPSTPCGGRNGENEKGAVKIQARVEALVHMGTERKINKVPWTSQRFLKMI
jgi:hypothetical protein